MKKKLKVGLYGYRDLKQDELEVALYLLETTLQCLMRKESDRELILVSALSLEIDKKIIKIAQKLGVRYDVVLPSKPTLCYSSVNYESHREFYSMLLSSRGYTIEHDEVLGEKLVDATDVMLCIDSPTTPTDISDTIEYSIKSKRDYTIIIDIKKSNGEESVLREDLLTQVEKFAVMSVVFDDIYVDYRVFAKKLGIGASTVNNWERRQGKNIQKPTIKAKICELFRLQHTVWVDEFENEIEFQNALPDYKKIERVIEMNNKEKIDSIILGSKSRLAAHEEDLIAQLSEQKEINYPIEDMNKKTPLFLFELAHILKSKNQIKDALSILEVIQNHPSSFKYTYYNQIEHLKAILLSHKDIKQYDDAIDILNLLYSASQYHLKEPEVLTLLASNFKRKALSDSSTDNKWIDKDSIDTKLLTSAIIIYYDSYREKKDKDKYYDAINLAYLLKIADSVEMDELESEIGELEIERLYKELTLHWRVDDRNWWEVSSDAEFLMLLGKTDLAISKINDFLGFEYNANNKFNIESTLRQLEMYLHFVDDANGREFYEYLVESLKGVDG